MKFDLSKFKRLKSDEKSTTLQHPDGHQIVIAHAPLTPKVKKQLGALPAMMAEGGEVDDKDESPAPESTPISLPGQLQSPPESLANPDAGKPKDGDIETLSPDAQAASNPGSLPFGVSAGDVAAGPLSTSSQMPSSAPQLAPNASFTTDGPMPNHIPAATPGDSFGVDAFSNQYNKGLNQQMQGIEGEARATKIQADAQAQVLEKAQANEAALSKNYHDNLSQLESHRQNLEHDIANFHVDPNRYLSSRPTGTKILNTVGLILGGMGSAMSGQENLAAKMLMKNIDNDMEAQKLELGKKENLLSANMKQFGNLRDATDMTRVMTMDVVKNQLLKAAAETADPMAKARALQAAGQLNQQAAPIVSQNAMRRSLLGGMAQGQVSPERVVNMLVPEHQRADANKELTTAQNMTASKDNILSAFDQVNKMWLGGNLSPHQRDALIEPKLAQLVKDSEGRITLQDVPMIKVMFPSGSDVGGTDSETRVLKRRELNNFVSSKMHFPILKTYGIDPGHLGMYNQQGQSKFNEAAPVIKK